MSITGEVVAGARDFGPEPPLPSSRFTTADIPPDRRFAVWRESIGVLFDNALDARGEMRPFHVELETLRVGEILFSRCCSLTQSFRRDPLKISADGFDHYLVQVLRQGSIEILGDGRVVRPGDIYVMDMAAPLHTVDHDFDYLTLVIPRLLVEGHLARPDEHHLRIIPRERTLARLLAGTMASIDTLAGELTAADAGAVMNAALGLVTGALNAEAPARRAELEPGAADQATLLAAKRFIELNLADASLRPDAVASAIGVSRSRLYRLFEPLGGVARYVRMRRLKRSVRDLLDPRSAGRRVYDIAYAWGFRDETEYARVFRRAFGMTPREARAMGSALRRSGEAVDDGRQYERWLLELAS